MHAEGATYLWTPAGLEALLGPADGPAVAALMNVQPRGTVTADGSPLHPGREITGADAELWRRVQAAAGRGPQRTAAARPG